LWNNAQIQIFEGIRYRCKPVRYLHGNVNSNRRFSILVVDVSIDILSTTHVVASYPISQVFRFYVAPEFFTLRQDLNADKVHSVFNHGMHEKDLPIFAIQYGMAAF